MNASAITEPENHSDSQHPPLAKLSAFVRDNPDCKPEIMLRDIHSFLVEIMEAEGRIDEREEMAIERVASVFTEETSFFLSRTISPLGNTAKALGAGVVSALKKPWSGSDNST